MSENKRPRLQRGEGRRQVLACIGRIREMAAEGYNPLLAYETLAGEGLLTISYSAFYDLVTQRKRKRKVKVLHVMPIEPPLTEVLFPLPNASVPEKQWPPSYQASPQLAQPLPAQEFSISVRPAPAEKPKGRSKRGLQGVLDGNIEAGAQLETQTAPVDDDPEYAEKKKRVTGKKSGKGGE